MPNNIIDTNIIIVANRQTDACQSEISSEECYFACLDCIETVMKEKVVLDFQEGESLIMKEYEPYASRSGEPEVGDQFFKWLCDNQFKEEHCTLVPITPSGNEEFLFKEISNITELRGFDPSDQKFLATAIVAPKPVIIHNAVDSDWQQIASLQGQLKITINELCPDCLKSLDVLT